ncbi:hypothetical protein [Kocuria sp.]|uniref:hypothetical protein n=1 Tax=Kocuria sp. TaxID=1871328 RepID=UPI0026E0E37E|nr:hypothetical protein [Kocuria sp.]MDO5617932.1 hypothetical protein [Kocuria sp.]
MLDYLAVLLPSIGVGLIFWFVMRSVMRADRGEREAEKAARQDAEQWYRDVKARAGQSGEGVGRAESGRDQVSRKDEK